MTSVRLVRLAAHLPGGTVVTSGPELRSVVGAVGWEAEYEIRTTLQTKDAIYVSDHPARGRGRTRAGAIRSATAAMRRTEAL